MLAKHLKLFGYVQDSGKHEIRLLITVGMEFADRQ